MARRFFVTAPTATDESALTVFEVHDRAKAVVLQFESVIRVLAEMPLTGRKLAYKVKYEAVELPA